MDGLIRDLPLLPPEQPLPMPRQDFRAAYRDAAAPDATERRAWRWRMAALGPAVVATVTLWSVIHGWFDEGGISWTEGLLLALICFNFFWISFTLTTVLAGFTSLAARPVERGAARAHGLDVALLMPIYNEDTGFVLGNARTMLEALHARPRKHRYSLFVLSDTQDPALAEAELRGVAALRADLPPGCAVYYRRRLRNTERKVGNIADWVTRWGGGWEVMLVLDADSLMTGEAIDALANAMASDPGAGLIQSFPQVLGAKSVFGRMQQFGNRVYGAALAEGVARISGTEGNYWGHNAILRTAAFAASAGLPRLPGKRAKLIMSHDFVEAGLLARAGWRVRFLPRIPGSFEETPATLIDHVLRDRRWCQGNLQHLRLLAARDFRTMSRFHMFHGAVGYLLSPIWFALLVTWALIGPSEEASVLTYFSEDNPLRPNWPEMTEGRHVLIILVMYAMLLAPKLVGAAVLPLTGQGMRRFGGAGRFALSMLVEIILAIIYAPILMVQQGLAVMRALLGLQKGWMPQTRAGGRYGWRVTLQFHILETLSGFLLVAGIAVGMVSVWLLPIGLSLGFAVPLSRLSGMVWRRGALLDTDMTGQGAVIEAEAQLARASLRQALNVHPAE